MFASLRTNVTSVVFKGVLTGMGNGLTWGRAIECNYVW